MRRQTAKDDRARRRRTSGTPSRAQGVRQRAGGADRAAGAGRPTGCLFCCDKRSPGCVGRARRSLVRRTSRTPPRSLLRLPAVAKGSPLSRDETLPGTGPLQRRSNAKVFARRCTRQGTSNLPAEETPTRDGYRMPGDSRRGRVTLFRRRVIEPGVFSLSSMVKSIRSPANSGCTEAASGWRRRRLDRRGGACRKNRTGGGRER